MRKYFKVVALDIETAHAPAWAVEKEAEIAIKKVKRLKAKVYKTESKQAEELERIELDYFAKCDEKRQEIKDKSALSNSAPVACTGLVADGVQYHFSTFAFTPQEDLTLMSAGIMPFTFENERDQMMGLSWWMNTYCDIDTQYVGHNAWHFDYPKLRLAFIRNNLQLPFALSKENKWNCLDTNQMFSFFSGDQYTSLEKMCIALDVSFTKSMSGAEVPAAIERKEFLKVTLYNMPDVWACLLAFRRMRGF